MLQLTLTGRVPEVGRRPAYIVDIALEVLHLRQLFRFAYYRVKAAAPDLPSLMISKRAETAAAETSAVADYAELDLSESRYLFLVNGMRRILKWKLVDVVQFLSFERRLRRILYDKIPAPIWLRQPQPVDAVVFSVLQTKTLAVGLSGGDDLLKIRQHDRFTVIRRLSRPVAGPAYPGYVRHIDT